MPDLIQARDLVDQGRILLKALEMAANALSDREEQNAIAELAALARDKLDEAKDVLATQAA